MAWSGVVKINRLEALTFRLVAIFGDSWSLYGVFWVCFMSSCLEKRRTTREAQIQPWMWHQVVCSET